MSYNLNGNAFGTESIGYGPSNLDSALHSNSRAVLYLFKPYQNQFIDVALRPYNYHFNEETVLNTTKMMDLSKRGTVGESQMLEHMMSQNNFNANIIPTPTPVGTLRTSTLSDCWRFILMLSENASDRLIIPNTSYGSPRSGNILRRIYTGFFVDEPLSIQRTYNPHAYMVITHKTVVEKKTMYGALGPQSQVVNRTSEEILNPGIFKNLATGNVSGDNATFVMTPQNCINSIDATGEGLMAYIPGSVGDITGEKASSVIPDILEQPSYNIQKVLSGIIQFQDEMTTRKELTMHRSVAAYDDVYLDGSMIRNKLGTYMSLPQSKRMSEFDLDVDSRISINHLDEMVNGELDIQDISLHRPLYHETMDQMETSLTTTYSSMIAAVIPPLLNAAGLNRIHFEFEIAQRFGGLHRNFLHLGAGGTYEMTPDEIRLKAKAVEIELVNGMFAMLFEAMGDFHLIVAADCTGMTQVRLSLVGQGRRAEADYEVPSCLGGMVSPLIGDLNVSTSNSHALSDLYGRVTGVTPATAGFNEEDHDFVNYAVNYENKRTDEYNFGDQLTFSGG